MGDAETGDLREDDGWARTALDRRLFGGHSSILPFLIDYLGWRPTGGPKRWRHGDGRGRPRRRNPVQGKMAAAVRDMRWGEAGVTESSRRWGGAGGGGSLESMERSYQRRCPGRPAVNALRLGGAVVGGQGRHVAVVGCRRRGRRPLLAASVAVKQHLSVAVKKDGGPR